MEELQKAALASHGPNPNVFLRPEERVGGPTGGSMSGSGGGTMMGMQPQQTRHARRLYIGQLAGDLSEQDVHSFFQDAIQKALGEDENSNGDDPILSVYINKERHFAFVEFKSMDVTTACLALNGMNMRNMGKIIVKRPNDYNPANAPAASPEFMRKFDVSKLGIISSIVPDSPHKIFIGGLPYHLNEEQVMELLGAFGKIKAFHLVKNDAMAVTSKGYCFVEYADENVTDVAIMGLNGMDMGGNKVLSAKIASKRKEGEGEEIGTAAIAGALAVTPIVPLGDMMSTYSGGVSSAPPIMRNVDGVDVEALVDVAMGTANVSRITASNGVANANANAAAPSNPLDIANAALQAVYGNGTNPATPSHANGNGNGNGSSGKTHIVVLQNMVTDEDFVSTEDYEGLKEEVKEECEKFGSLISMVIPHPEVRPHHQHFLMYLLLFVRLHDWC
jgi:splicing factor U2AF subunit